MKILYIHGFASKYDATNDKVVALASLGNVVGIDIDYTQPKAVITSLLIETITQHGVDLIVGTSMGGYYAAEVGHATGLPFVACNPAVDPGNALRKYTGPGHVDYSGNKFEVPHSVVDEYKSIETGGCGLILLDQGDGLFDSNKTAKLLEQSFKVELFNGGSHRFMHMAEAAPMIAEHYEQAGVVYGA